METTNFYATTRGKCMGGVEPCDQLHCRFHVLSDKSERKAKALPLPRIACALKLANLGGMTLEDVGRAMAITRERVRQVEAKAVANMTKKFRQRHLGERVSCDKCGLTWFRVLACDPCPDCKKGK